MINIHVASYCENIGKPMQKAACSAILRYTDDFNRSSSREISFALGNSTKNQADLQSIRLAILSVRRKFRSEPIFLYHNSYYGNGILEERDKKRMVNQDLILEVFKAIDSCSKLKIIKSESGFENAIELAKSTANTQKSIDSGTTSG